MARQIERSLKSVRAKRIARGIANRFTPRAPAWTGGELALLGKAPDQDVACRLGRTLIAVIGKRRALRIRAARV